MIKSSKKVKKLLSILVPILALFVLPVCSLMDYTTKALPTATQPWGPGHLPPPLVFEYPVDQQVLDYEGAYMFKVTDIEGAQGYLWSFSQNGVVVWENLRDEMGLTAGGEYAILEESEAHQRFAPGPVEVNVRAQMGDYLADATRITIYFQPTVDLTKTTLEMEATSMSAFVTQQAATLQAATLQAIQPPDQVYPIAIYPPYDSPSGYLLGGSRDGNWLDATATAAYLKGGEQYAIYTDYSFLGTSTGTLPLQNPPFCPAFQEVTLNPMLTGNSIVAIGGNWNALPRLPQEISTGHELYRQVIFDLLQANGILQPEVRLNRALKVDLEGDGVDEVLISASHFVDETGHETTAGDYSVVILRKVTGNTAVSIPLITDYYPPGSQPVAFPDMHVLTAVLDLDGDGRMEIVISITGWEKTGALGYEIDGATIREVLRTDC